MTGRARRIVFGSVRFALAGAMLLFLATTGRVDWSALRGLRDHWVVTLLALALLCVVFCLVSQRACLLFRARGLHLSLRNSLGLSLIANLFALVLPGGGGDIVRLYYTAKNAAGRRTEIGTLLLLDRVAGLLALTLFPIIAAPLCVPLLRQSSLLRALLLLAGGSSLLIVFAIAVSTSRRARTLRGVLWLLRTFPLRGYPTRMLDTMQGFRDRMSVLAATVGLSLIAHAISMAIVWLLVAEIQGGRASAEANAVPFLASLGFMANNIPVTPGGLGVGEAAFDSLFRIAGLDGGAEAMLAWRVLLLALAPAGLWFYLSGRVAAARVITAKESG
jgi:glycosyltransferase 2 family protein